MKLPVLTLREAESLDAFVNYWSSIYSYPFEHLYYSNIGKPQYDPPSLKELFKWKNGMLLSTLKEKAFIEKIAGNLDIINFFKGQEEVAISDFRQEFKDLSAVWKIFLLHIVNPKKYPIYDQHVHRAYAFLNNLDFTNISSTISNKQKEQFYFGEYLEFVAELQVKNLKKMDEAFFSFGQFINPKRNKYYQLLTNNN